MGDDSEEKGGRFADPNPEWKRFRPLTLDKDGKPVVDEVSLEEGWAEESEPESPRKRRWSLTWVAILSAGTLTALAVLAYKHNRQKDVSVEKPVYRSVAERRSIVKDQLRAFLQASTLDDRLAHILEPERLRPMVDEYYQREDAYQIVLDRIDEVKAVKLAEQPWVWISFSDKDGGAQFASFKETPSGFKLDWESLVVYGELPWETLRTSRPTDPVQMRVYLRNSDYYNWKYQDRAKYAAFEIETRELSEPLYGYVERESVAFEALRNAVAPGSRQPVNVRLRFEDDAGDENLVIIDELLHSLWIAPSILGETE